MESLDGITTVTSHANGIESARLTAANELLTKSDDYEVIGFEESACYGGISKTVKL